MRHANASFYDDACIQVRSCSLKFADTDFSSPLDILMNSGPTSAFWDLKSFMDFALARTKCTEKNWSAQEKWMKASPAGYIGAIDAVRHAPTSFAEMTYYSKICFPFKARDDQKRYVKYRILPVDLEHESGLITPEMQTKPWQQCRLAEDDRPRSYLREEYLGRLKKHGKLNYRLQIQLRAWHPETDTAEFFNMNRLWDEERWPWLDCAHVQVAEALPEKVTERMAMWLGHQPPSLGLTDAHSPVDYRSLCWARPQIYPVSRRLRSIGRNLHVQMKMPHEF
jgi:catalase